MVSSNLWEDPTGLKDALRFALTTSGGQCVMTFGMQVMLKWSALNLEYPSPQVQNSNFYSEQILNPLINSLCKQARHCLVGTLVKGVGPSSWMMYLAMEQKSPCSPAIAA